MPLIKSKSKKARRKNYLELVSGPVGSARQKAIRTIMRKRGWSFERTKAWQAGIIAARIQGGKKKRKKKKK